MRIGRAEVYSAAGYRSPVIRRGVNRSFAGIFFSVILPFSLAAQTTEHSGPPFQFNTTSFNPVKSAGMETHVSLEETAINPADVPESENLPSAPEVHLDATGTDDASDASFAGSSIQPTSSEVTLEDCPYDKTGARVCRVHWHQLAIASSMFLAFENAGNLYTGYWYRWETGNGKWWNRYVDSVQRWRWNRWSDDNPFLDDYVGHPMMGAITNSLWMQHDPKSMYLEQSNTWPYWRSLMRATAFSTAYSFQWKLGPLGEASIGHNGDHFFPDQGARTNETGWVELVTTPVGGTLWTLGEDAIDKHVIRHLEDKSRNPVALLAYSFMNPARGTANIFRFRPPWFRDSRTVKATTFWSDPPPPYDRQSVGIAAAEARDATRSTGGESAVAEAADPPPAVSMVRRAVLPSAPLPQWPHPGGVHEFGARWGLSLISGHIWGYAKDVKYMPVDIRYSYLLREYDHWTLRYSPELTALAMLDEPVNPLPKNVQKQRKRTYGSGLSPVGFQTDFFPSRRVQPFFSGDGGFIYFMDRVLSPQGSQWMYTIDYGAGINIFRKARQAVTIGYRYQHLSNANISKHNPGLDANTFYVSVSRFRTKGYR